jgi:asparagine synthase (glutamine-hydrolysing)
MCGFVGVLAPRPDGLRDRVARATQTLNHRGPDDRGIESVELGEAGHLVVGHTRLAIIDVRPEGHQPMIEPDGACGIAYNGEVYNFAELRGELEAEGGPYAPPHWRSLTDTEAILKLFRRDGVSAARRLRGMFAFAAWDTRDGSLLLARDRFGIKPLYYAEVGGRLAFGSEVRALLATGLIDPEIDRDALAGYLACGAVQDPLTLIRGLRSLLPGHVLSWKNGRSTVEPYWSLPTELDLTVSLDDAISEVRRLLREAMRLHLISDVPLGVFLSGGVDSGGLLAFMAEVSDRPVTAVTVACVPESPGAPSELPHARRVAERHGARQVVVEVNLDEAAALLPEIVSRSDQPSIDGPNTFLAARAARQAGCKVVLTGLGSDELFAGYASFHTARRLGPVLRTGAATRLGQALARLPLQDIRLQKIAAALRSGGDPQRLTAIGRRLFMDWRIQRLLRPEWRAAPQPDAEEAPGDLVNAVSHHELTHYMRNMLLRDADAMSMAHSVELRPPYLDHVLAEFVLQLPGRYKVAPFARKPLLVRALGRRLPAEVARRRKQGFALAIGDWLRGPLRGWVEEVLGAQIEPLDPAAVDQVYRRFLGGERRFWSRVFGLVVLFDWVRRHAPSMISARRAAA